MRTSDNVRGSSPLIREQREDSGPAAGGMMEVRPSSPRKQGPRSSSPFGKDDEEENEEEEEIDEDVYEEDFEEDEEENFQRLALTPRQLDTDPEVDIHYEDSEFEDEVEEPEDELAETTLDVSIESANNIESARNENSDGEDSPAVAALCQTVLATDDTDEEKDTIFQQSAIEGGWTEIPFKDLELGSQIGGGGVGIVYSGWYQDESVALKTLFDTRVTEELKQEYMDELLILSKLRHPNIVDFYGAAMKPPNLCFVMELCQYSVFTLLHQTSEELNPKQMCNMLVGVASAMWYLHTRKPQVIHRDIKSANVLVADDGKLKLCDFGLVSTKITVAGTPSYMCPELLEKKPFSRKVDCYSFAILMWEMFSRVVPYAGLMPFEIKETVCVGERLEMPPEARMPFEIQDLCERAWAQDPSDRPEFDEIERRLGEIVVDLPDGEILSNVQLMDQQMGGDVFGF